MSPRFATVELVLLATWLSACSSAAVRGDDPAACGNGTVEGGEECDGVPGSDVTCATLGYAGGELACGAGCQLDVSGCRTCPSGRCEPGETSAECPEDCAVEEVEALRRATCALRVDGSVACWGDLDPAVTQPVGDPVFALPTTIDGLERVRTMDGGKGHLCGVRADGSVTCWGDNRYAQLGRGHNAPSGVGAVVPGLEGVAQVAAGSRHSCAVRDDGAVLCWGSNTELQLGLTEDDPRLAHHTTVEDLGTAGIDVTEWIGAASPVLVEGLSDIVQLSACGDTSCAVVGDGAVYCWGEACLRWDPLSCPPSTGDCVLRTDRCGPTWVEGVTSAVAVEVGHSGVCALLDDGRVKCWGAGSLGDGSSAGSDEPVSVSNLQHAVGIEAGGGRRVVCSVTGAEELYCWGDNSTGLIDPGSPSEWLLEPSRVALGGSVHAVAANYHLCALLADSTVLCWGENSTGQLGDGTTQDRSVPLPVPGL